MNITLTAYMIVAKANSKQQHTVMDILWSQILNNLV